MPNLNDYLALDATAMAAGLRDGEFKASELVSLAVQQAHRVNPTINAINVECYDEALALAADLDESPARLTGEVAGVPFLIKDLSLLKGHVATHGSCLYQDAIATRSANIVARYLDAGLVILGKTNTPEFGLTLTTEPVANGATRNPWNLDYSTGGSSGGAAAAVAAGIVPVAHATDGGGSIRIPASCCGLFGLKPSRGLTTIESDIGDSWSGMSVCHVVSRTVRDSAMFLNLITLDEARLYPMPAVPRSFNENLDAVPKGLRIAVQNQHPFGETLNPDVIEAVEMAAQLCESLGHHVELVQHPANYKAAAEAMNKLVCIHTFQGVNRRLQEVDIELDAADVENSTRQMAKMGAKFSAVDYLRARDTLTRLERRMALFHQDYDVLLSPVLTKTTAKLGWLDMNTDDLIEYGARFRAYGGFTALYNGTGQPSASLPLFQDSAGLPVGIMATAAWGNDRLLLQLSAQLEQAAPWPQIAPFADKD